MKCGCYEMLDPNQPPSCQSDELEIPTDKYGNLTFIGTVCVCNSDLCNNLFSKKTLPLQNLLSLQSLILFAFFIVLCYLVQPLSCFQCATLTNPKGCLFPTIVTCNARSRSCYSATGLVNSSKNCDMLIKVKM